jgi:glycosyltransferase involved in cell wall biosynthesis
MVSEVVTAAPSRPPRVSVVVPAFNESAAALAESLGSLRAQTFLDFECLVVDESTRPDLAQACRLACKIDRRFRYVHPPTRLGLAASLNLGIGQARGELIARFDSDDVCLPHRLSLQVAYMDAHPEVGVLGGGLEIMSEDGRTLAFRDYPQDHATIEKRFQATTPIAHPTVMLRKSLIERHGGYDSSFRFAEDLDLWLRLLNHGVRFANLGSVLVRYRQDSTSRNTRHWQFNRRARMRNFSSRYLVWRVLGLLAIIVWAVLPASLQGRVFDGLLFRRAG